MLGRNLRGFVIARDGHVTDDGQDIIINVVVGDEDVTDPPTPAVVVPVLLAIAVIIDL